MKFEVTGGTKAFTDQIAGIAASARARYAYRTQISYVFQGTRTKNKTSANIYVTIISNDYVKRAHLAQLVEGLALANNLGVERRVNGETVTVYSDDISTRCFINERDS